MIKVVLLGAGKVAKHLYNAFRKESNVTVIQCYNRKNSKLHNNQNENEITNDLTNLLKADVYIIAVSDDAIATLSEKLDVKEQ